MGRIVVFAYGLVCYSVFFATFLYLMGFLANFGVPHSIDSGEAGPLGVALLVNGLLIALFGVQHSVMARPGFKARLTRVVPEAAERSTYVLATSAVLVLLFWLWRPIPGLVWDVEAPALRSALTGLFVAGMGLVLVSTFLIDHFDLFGLRQVWFNLRGEPYTTKRFMTPAFYRWIRHPLYLGFFLTFWVTPTMSWGHVLFAAGFTAYILIAIPLEERDLLHHLGEDYGEWRKRTPAFLPFGSGPT